MTSLSDPLTPLVDRPVNARQGEVWLAQLAGKNNPRDRANPHHVRPIVVVTTDLYNEFGRAFLVAPVLSCTPMRERLPTNLILEVGDGGVTQRSVIFNTQMRAVAPWRMLRKTGMLSPAILHALKETLRITFDLD